MNNVLEQVSPKQVQQGSWLIVDVRSTSERAASCIPGSLHLPLQEVESGVLLLQRSELPIALLCQGGLRAELAQQRLARHGVVASVMAGGLNRWKSEGLPVEQRSKSRWSLERQVRFGAGLLVLCGTLAALVFGRVGLVLTGLVGTGLTFAGATDICMMGRLLARMPWNRAKESA